MDPLSKKAASYIAVCLTGIGLVFLLITMYQGFIGNYEKALRFSLSSFASVWASNLILIMFKDSDNGRTP